MSCRNVNIQLVYLLNSSNTKMPPFWVKHFLIWSILTKNCKRQQTDVLVKYYYLLEQRSGTYHAQLYP